VTEVIPRAQHGAGAYELAAVAVTDGHLADEEAIEYEEAQQPLAVEAVPRSVTAPRQLDDVGDGVAPCPGQFLLAEASGQARIGVQEPDALETGLV
jgi:hypothetical protein